MEDNTVTIYDVARAAGVSMATISRVVNGNPNVREATREKVLKVIEELNYRPNAIARGLASKRTTTIGVVLPSLTNSYYAELAVGIEDVAAMYNYEIILANTDERPEREMAVLDTFMARQVDGIIFMGYQLTDELRQVFSRARTPVVLAGMVDLDNQLPVVNLDYEGTVSEMVEKLANFHEKVALVCGPLVRDINKERLAGYKAGLEAAGKSFSEAMIFETPYSYEEGQKLAGKVREKGVQAAFVANDEVAAGLLNALIDSGVKVPDDFEIITANNSRISKYTRPALTTVGQPIYDFGAVSMRMLTKLIAGEKLDEKRVVLPSHLIVRGTTYR